MFDLLSMVKVSRCRVTRVLEAGLLLFCAGLGACGESRLGTAIDSGPALLTPEAELDAAIEHFPASLAGDHEPVLLVHGTGSTPEESWGWTYARVLPTLGFDVYTVRLPDRALVDMQVSAEFVVHALRRIHQQTGRKVDVIGHSQGGVFARWGLKWWPDLREIVDDAVAISTPRDGTIIGTAVCAAGCGAAIWQVAYNSQFIMALNRDDPTPGDDVSYTTVLSLTDEIAEPGIGLGPAPNAVDLFVQDLCPLRPVDHISMVADAAVFAVVLDALTHPGSFDVARFDPDSCGHLTMSGVTELDLATQVGIAGGNAALAIVTASPRLLAEPVLRPYVKADRD